MEVSRVRKNNLVEYVRRNGRVKGAKNILVK